MISLFKAFTENCSEAKANFLALSGLRLVFNNHTDESSKLLIAELFKSNVIADILFGNRALYNSSAHGELLSTAFNYAKSNGIDLSTKPGFKEYIVLNANRLNEDIAAQRYKNHWESCPSDYVAIIEAGFLSGTSSPEAIFEQKFSKYGNYYRLGNFDTQLMKSIAARSPKVIIDQIEHIDFGSKVSYTIRSAIYGAIAETGHLTKKAARKIRSDASEEAASNGIHTIANNIHKFPNANEVLAQIMDTKYFAPAKFLAETVPMDLLPFMVVCQNNDVRKIVVDRIEKENAAIELAADQAKLAAQ